MCVAGYVPQTEMFMHHLTPREHLTFHALNRMSYDWTKPRCLARVEEVSQVMLCCAGMHT